MSRPRFDLNVVHVTATTLAALTGAVVTSDFGTAGTLVGTAVASLIGTTGTAVYQHYLGSTKERISAAAPVIAQRTHIWHPAPGTAEAVHAGNDPPPADAPEHGDSDSGEEPTQISGEEPAQVPGEEPAEILPRGAAASGDIPPGEQPARLPGASDAGGGRDGLAHPPGTPAGGEEMPGAQHPAGGDRADRGRRGRWVLPCVAAAAFVIALVAVTVFELAAGKPLDAAIWGHKGAGTTVGDVVTGSQGVPATPKTPALRPPAPGATSPAPSPTTSPSPSRPGATPSSGTSPSASAHPTVSPSPSGGSPSVGPGILGGSPSPGGAGTSPSARPQLKIPLP